MSVGVLFKTRGIGAYPEQHFRRILEEFLTAHNLEGWTLFINLAGGNLMIESVSSEGHDGKCSIPMHQDAPRLLRKFLEEQHKKTHEGETEPAK